MFTHAVIRNLLLVSVIFLFSTLGLTSNTLAEITKLPEGDIVISDAKYIARIGNNGTLSSFIVFDANRGPSELLAESIRIGDVVPQIPANNTIIYSEQISDTSVTLTLALKNSPSTKIATIIYTPLAANELEVKLTPTGNRIRQQMLLSPTVIAAETLKRPLGGFAFSRPYIVPLLRLLPVIVGSYYDINNDMAGLRDLRYWLPNGHYVDNYYFLNDAPYNPGEGGSLGTTTLSSKIPTTVWQHGLITGERRYIFGVDGGSGSGQPVAPRKFKKTFRPDIPFALTYTDNSYGLFPRKVPIPVRLSFQRTAPWAPKTTGNLTFSYSFFDMNGKKVKEGKEVFSATLIQDKNNRRWIDLKLKSIPVIKGWFLLRGELSSIRGSNIRSEGALRVVIHARGIKGIPAGISTFNGSISEQARIYSVLGLKCNREAFGANNYYPSYENSPMGNASFNYNNVDNALRSVIRSRGDLGMNTLLTWDSGPPNWVYSKYSSLNDRANAYEQLMKATFERYAVVKNQYLASLDPALRALAEERLRIFPIETENEPEGKGYTLDTTGNKSLIGLLLAPAYRAAQATTSQEVHVLGPALTSIYPSYINQFVNLGGTNYIHEYSTHAYTGWYQSWEQHETPAMIAKVREFLGLDPKFNKLWQTESGYQNQFTYFMPLAQAKHLLRMLLLGETRGIPRSQNCIYRGAQGGFECWHMWSPPGMQPSGAMVRILHEMLLGKEFKQEIDVGKFAHAVRFGPVTGKTSDIIVLWSLDFSSPLPLRVSAPLKKIKLYDVMGNAMPLENYVRKIPLSIPICVCRFPAIQSISTFPEKRASGL